MSNDSKEKVFVCGGGHQGLSMAAHLALNGVEVTLWNRTSENIRELTETHEIHCFGVVSGTAHIKKASSDINEVVSDVIMVTTPSTAHIQIAKMLASYVNEKTVIILNPGRTFGAIEFAEALKECNVEKLPHIAETQTIVYTCRRSGKNDTSIFALKNNVQIAALKNSDIDYIMSKIPQCLRNYYAPVESVAITSLSNVGMVLHCAPVLMNVGWIESDKADFKYYYDGISKSVAGVLERIDSERVSVAKQAGYNIESLVQWLKRTYSANGDDIFSCIKSVDAYRGIDAPPSIQTRYLYEDIPNGLVPVENMAKAFGMKTPTITTVIDFACEVTGIDFRCNSRRFSQCVLEKYI